jgi:hypothetical protein
MLNKFLLLILEKRGYSWGDPITNWFDKILWKIIK